MSNDYKDGMSKGMQIDIPDKLSETLLRKYVTDNLSYLSADVFDDYIAVGKTSYEAMGYAVFNEIVNKILKDKIKKGE